MCLVVFIYEAPKTGRGGESRTTLIGKDVQPQKVTFRADIRDNRFVVCTWCQIYEIGDLDVAESEVRFPVDYRAAVCDLLVTTPRETIRGVVQEKSQAQATYEEGKKEGKQVFLVDQSVMDNDVLKLTVGNIKAHDVIKVEFTYVSELVISDNSGSFFIPSQITPRYRGEHIPAGSFGCQVDVYFWGPVKKFGTSTPNVNFEIHPDHVHASCRTTQSFDRDIDLKFDLDMTQRSFAMSVAGYQLNYVQFLPKISSDRANKEFILVLDCSGSMAGGRIRNAKRALMTLLQEMQSYMKSGGVGYSFNLIRYGSTHQSMWSGLRYSDVDSMNFAMKYCAMIDANMGGTETYSALEAALKQSSQCILITDGDTSDNATLHHLCEQFNSLCILGIGNGINRDNIERMSRSGHGICAFNSEDSDVTDNIIRLFKTSSMPVIRNVVETVPGLTEKTDQPPAAFTEKRVLTSNPEMFYTKNPIIPNIFYRLYGITSCKTDNLLEKCTISGTFAEHHDNIQIREDFQLDHEVDKFYTDRVAKLMVKHVLEQNKSMDSTTAVQLAVAFGIITDKTSMVAVGKAKVGAVPELQKPPLAYQKKSAGFLKTEPPSMILSCLSRSVDSDRSVDLFNQTKRVDQMDARMKRKEIQQDFNSLNLRPSKELAGAVQNISISPDTNSDEEFSTILETGSMEYSAWNSTCSGRRVVTKTVGDMSHGSSSIDVKYMVSLKMPFEELVAYFRPELGVFSANVLTFIGVNYDIYDPVAITLYLLYLIRFNYTEEQYQKIAKMADLGDRQAELKAISNKSITDAMIASSIFNTD